MRRGWWKRDGSARPGDDRKRRDGRWPRGHRLTVARPLDVVGKLQRQRFKLRVGTTAKCRILDRLTASPEQAIQRRRVGTSQIRWEPTRTMQPGRSRDYGLYRRVGGTHIGRRSPTSTVERQTSWTTHELTSRRARNPAPASPTSEGPIGVTAAHVTPRKIRRSARTDSCADNHSAAQINPSASWSAASYRTCGERTSEPISGGSRSSPTPVTRFHAATVSRQAGCSRPGCPWSTTGSGRGQSFPGRDPRPCRASSTSDATTPDGPQSGFQRVGYLSTSQGVYRRRGEGADDVLDGLLAGERGLRRVYTPAA